MRIISWEEFDLCVKKIVYSCSTESFCGVYGFPRGGLCLAVALSHSLKIPLLQTPTTGSLVVDDVYETGKTLNQVAQLPGITTFVWFSKTQPIWWNAVDIVNSEEWLVLPWENRACAEEDKNAYQLSRA
mgnify:CR=1 FL=1